MMMRIYLDDLHLRMVEIPITQTMTCADVIGQCSKDRHKHYLAELWRGHEQFSKSRGKGLTGHNLTNKVSDTSVIFTAETAAASVEKLRALAERQREQLRHQESVITAREQRLRYLQQQQREQSKSLQHNSCICSSSGQMRDSRLKELRASTFGNRLQHRSDSCMELRMAKSEFAEKEEELSKAFAKIESLLEELSNLHKRKISGGISGDQQEMELDKLRLELELRNRLNVERGQLLNAQQRSLLVRRQINDAVIQNIDRLHHQPEPATLASLPNDRHTMPRSSIQNGRSVSGIKKTVPFMSYRVGSDSAADTRSSQSQNIHRPLILKPTASLRKNIGCHSSTAESFGCEMSPDLPGQLMPVSVGQQTANVVNNSIDRQYHMSSPLLCRPAAVNNRSQIDTCSLDHNSSVNGEYVAASSLGRESGLQLVDLPPLTIALPSVSAAVQNCQSGSPRYFEELDFAEGKELSGYDALSSGSSEITASLNSVPSMKPSCVFASKSIIATTYLSRRPPICSPIHVGSRSGSVDGQSPSSNHVDDSSASASPPVKLIDTKQPSVDNVPVTAVVSPLLPPRLSSNNKHLYLSHSSLPKLHKALSPKVYRAPPSADADRSLSANVSKNFCADSLNTLPNSLSDSLLVTVTSPSAYVPLNTATDVTSASLSSSVYSSDMSFRVTNSPTLLSSAVSAPLLAGKPLAEKMHSSTVTFHQIPQVWSCSSDVLAQFPDGSSLPSYTDAVLSADLITVSASSQSREQMSLSNIPVVGCAVPYTLTISSHIPVLSPPTDAVTSLLHTASSDVVNTVTSGTSCSRIPLSSAGVHIPSSSSVPSCKPIDTNGDEVADSYDIQITLSLPTASSDVIKAVGTLCTQIQSSSAAVHMPVSSSVISSQTLTISCKPTDTNVDEVADTCSPPDVQVLPDSPQLCSNVQALLDSPRLYTSSPCMTRRRLSSDATNTSLVMSPLSHVVVPKNASEQLVTDIAVDKTFEEQQSVDYIIVNSKKVEDAKQIDTETVVNKTAEDLKSVDCITTESTGVDADAFSDDASSDIVPLEGEPDPVPVVQTLVTVQKRKDRSKMPQRVSFSPLALLLDAALEGDLELVRNTAIEMENASEANDEGITALHNSVCAGHFHIVKFLVEIGCDVNAADTDGWTPLHCAASCNNVDMVKLLIDNGAAVFAKTISDGETALNKCEENVASLNACFQYLTDVEEQLGTINCGVVFGLFDHMANNPDELDFHAGDEIAIIRKGDDMETDWWWAGLQDREGYIPKNYIGLSPRVKLK